MQAVVDVEGHARHTAGEVRGEEEAGGAHVVRVQVLRERRVGLGVANGVPGVDGLVGRVGEEGWLVVGWRVHVSAGQVCQQCTVHALDEGLLSAAAADGRGRARLEGPRGDGVHADLLGVLRC